jgi:hypothetical protein
VNVQKEVAVVEVVVYATSVTRQDIFHEIVLRELVAVASSATRKVI